MKNQKSVLNFNCGIVFIEPLVFKFDGWGFKNMVVYGACVQILQNHFLT